MAACAAVDGIVYVIGGNNCYSNCWLSTNEAYNTQTNTWQPPKASIPTYPAERGLLSATTVNRKIYCIGGANSYASPGHLDNVDRYDPDTDTWQSLPPIPYGNRALHAAVELDGEIYLIGGRNWVGPPPGVSEVIAQVDVYNPATGQWRQVEPLPSPRWLLSAVVLNGRIYAIGGVLGYPPESVPVVTTIVEEYDPVLDCWRRVTALPVGTHWGTAEVLGRKIYPVGGSFDVANADVATDEVMVGCPTPVLGDINNDGVVDFADINPFVALLSGGR
jgi:N-acetylneuraminic acid mutarotase